MRNLRVLIVDNYDSFTYNLVQLVGELVGARPKVLTHDADGLELALSWASHVILSPGPGTPENETDIGACRTVLRHAETRAEAESLPVLGVCLGHQLIACHFGGSVRSAPRVMHGYGSDIEHDGRGVFAGCARRFHAVRYHSLVVAEPLPACLEVCARSADGVIMGLRHRSLPVEGVQFHPESVLSEEGARLVGNFLGSAIEPSVPGNVVSSRPAAPRTGRRQRSGEQTVLVRELQPGLSAGGLFAGLGGGDSCFWLDSAVPVSGQERAPRFSYVGRMTALRSASGQAARALVDEVAAELEPAPRGAEALPFDFAGGCVGYLGYELGRCYGLASAGEAPHPDVQLGEVNRFFAIEEGGAGRAWAVAVADGDDSEARAWLDAAASGPPTPGPCGGELPPLAFSPRRGGERYLADIAACLAAIARGDSYELCLTEQLMAEAAVSPELFYRQLRRSNPAPYGALLRFPGLAIASSSPELFLSVDRRGHVLSKPIKGTRPRGADEGADRREREALATSRKDRAENLMIADLVRNDLGRVCRLGSVRCDPLMQIESYATVHQLVTSVHGVLEPECGIAELIAATFPGGSMTGAPKRRTTEILAELEGCPRGIYAGAIGTLGRGGTATLAMAIRTAILTEDRITVGAGGAIVADSEPLAELEEMRHKARSVVGEGVPHRRGSAGSGSLS